VARKHVADSKLETESDVPELAEASV